MLEVRHIHVDGCNYASLCNDRGIHAFLGAIAARIGAHIESGPYGTRQAKRGNTPATLLWILALKGEGFLAFTSTPAHHSFSLVICYSREVSDEEIAPILEEYWGAMDAMGEKVLTASP
jgi:hypothetical protein